MTSHDTAFLLPYDRFFHGIPDIGELDGWTVLAIVKASDGNQWWYKTDVTKNLIAGAGWLGVRMAFDAVQVRLTREAPPFDPTTIQWSCRPWWWPDFSEMESDTE